MNIINICKAKPRLSATQPSAGPLADKINIAEDFDILPDDFMTHFK